MAISDYMRGVERTRRKKMKVAQEGERAARREVAERHLAEAFLILREKYPTAVKMELTFAAGGVPWLRKAMAEDGTVLLDWRPPVNGQGQMQTESELRHAVGQPAWAAFCHDPEVFDGYDKWSPRAPEWVTVRLS